jgi:hypothetical protein
MLLAAAALLTLPAPAQVHITIVPTKRIPPEIEVPRYKYMFEYPTYPPRYPKPPQLQIPMETQKRLLPPSEYDHDYDGELTLLRTLEPIVYRACQEVFKPGQRAIGCARAKLTPAREPMHRRALLGRRRRRASSRNTRESWRQAGARVVLRCPVPRRH